MLRTRINVVSCVYTYEILIMSAVHNKASSVSLCIALGIHISALSVALECARHYQHAGIMAILVDAGADDRSRRLPYHLLGQLYHATRIM